MFKCILCGRTLGEEDFAQTTLEGGAVCIWCEATHPSRNEDTPLEPPEVLFENGEGI